MGEELHECPLCRRFVGLELKSGTVADATLIAAPSSTKNKDGERDPEMHQTSKGRQWYFGMKAHIGVDAQSGLAHTVIGSAANVNDVTRAGALLHGEERAASGDAGYQGVQALQQSKSCHACRTIRSPSSWIPHHGT